MCYIFVYNWYVGDVFLIRSPSNLLDPTMTKTQRSIYSSNLARLFINYNTEIKKRFEDSTRQLETYTNMNAMDAYVEQTANDVILVPGKAIVDSRVQKIYQTGINWALLRMYKTDAQMGPADWRALDALKVRNLTALKKITNELNGQIMYEISEGVRLGEHPSVIAKRITERVDKIGITRAKMMARTETIHAFNQAAEIRYSQYGYDKLEWLAAAGCCDVCASLNGKVFSTSSYHERPPQHPNCRCALLPAGE